MQDILDELRRMAADEKGSHSIKIGEQTISIGIERFSLIPQATEDETANDEKAELTFIDGGQAVLFEGAGFCIGFIRVAAITYENNKRISRDIQEFHVSVSTDGLAYNVKTFPKTRFDGMQFKETDPTQSCSTMLSNIRRIAELATAGRYKNPILDGTLEIRYPFEKEFLEGIGSASAIAKTCSLTTTKGAGICDVLRAMRQGSWIYTLMPGKIYFVKLNEHSNYVFRFEDIGHTSATLNAIISTLSLNSNDAVFRGYPYGLIDADHVARVSEQEKTMLQTKISTGLGHDWNRVRAMLTSLDAHSVLDNIKF